MRPSLETEIIQLEKRIATLEKNKIGNMKREHDEIISTYKQMFETLRVVNMNRIFMILKINMMEIKSLKEECFKECARQQRVMMLQKEMALSLIKMIHIGQEENNIMLEYNQRLRDKIRLKRSEVDALIAEKLGMTRKVNKGTVIVLEKSICIERYHVNSPLKPETLSSRDETDGYHPKLLNLKKSKIPVLKMPLSSVVETVPFQISKKPVKVTIPHDRILILKKQNGCRVLKPRNVHMCEKKLLSKTESDRLGEKRKQQAKKISIRKSSNNFIVEPSKTTLNLMNDDVNDDCMMNINNVENDSKYVTPTTYRSKIPIPISGSLSKSSTTKTPNHKGLQTVTPIFSTKSSNNNHKFTVDDNKKNFVSVEDAAVVFKTLNDYCDKIEKMYGPKSDTPKNEIICSPKLESREKKTRSGEKRIFKRKPKLCSPCIPIKFRTDNRTSISQELAKTAQRRIYGSLDSVYSDMSGEEENKADGFSEMANNSIEVDLQDKNQTNEDESVLSSSTNSTGTTVIYRTETGATVISRTVASTPENNIGDSLSRDTDQTNLCKSQCIENVLTGCFSPRYKAGGDCFQASIEGTFRFLNSESEMTGKSLDEPVQAAHKFYDEDLLNSSSTTPRRKSEIFHISFNNKKNKLDASDTPSVFKLV